MRCKQWGRQSDAVLNLTLTCYGKQSSILNLANMAGSAVSLKVCYYFEALLWLLDVNKRWRRS